MPGRCAISRWKSSENPSHTFSDFGQMTSPRSYTPGAVFWASLRSGSMYTLKPVPLIAFAHATNRTSISSVRGSSTVSTYTVRPFSPFCAACSYQARMYSPTILLKRGVPIFSPWNLSPPGMNTQNWRAVSPQSAIQSSHSL